MYILFLTFFLKELNILYYSDVKRSIPYFEKFGFALKNRDMGGNLHFYACWFISYKRIKMRHRKSYVILNSYTVTTGVKIMKAHGELQREEEEDKNECRCK